MIWNNFLANYLKLKVPLTLAIRVAALRGTIQLFIKPPPSDQLWFGFTSMPDITFQLESSVKDHKINSGRVASFLINRFKASIRETLVIPNCESACVSWMLAEKDDWVPRNVAPFIWLNREAPSDATAASEVANSQSIVRKAGDHDQENNSAKLMSVESAKPPRHEDGGEKATLSSTAIRSSSESNIFSALKVPLLQNEGPREASVQNPECQSPSRYISLREQRNSFEDEDAKQKKAGRRARMFDLGKKMGEKIEEKRRHIEEKSRHIVVKMRGPGP